MTGGLKRKERTSISLTGKDICPASPVERVHPSPGDFPTPLAYRSPLKLCGSQAYRYYTDTHGVNTFRKTRPQ